MLTDPLARRHNQGTSSARSSILRNPPIPLSLLHPPPRPIQSRSIDQFRPDTSAPHRVSVTPECITAFNDLKLGKSTKWIIYKISDDWKEIVVEDSSKSADYSTFREKLLNAKSKDRRGNEGIGGRYAVYDMEYETGGEGKRYAICCSVHARMWA